MNVHALSTGEANPDLCEWSFDESIALMMYQTASSSSLFDARDLIHFTVDVDLNRFAESFASAVHARQIIVKGFRPALAECEFSFTSINNSDFPVLSDYSMNSESMSQPYGHGHIVEIRDCSDMTDIPALHFTPSLTAMCVGVR